MFIVVWSCESFFFLNEIPIFAQPSRSSTTLNLRLVWFKLVGKRDAFSTFTYFLMPDGVEVLRILLDVFSEVGRK
jgi:hypothetical protein